MPSTANGPMAISRAGAIMPAAIRGSAFHRIMLVRADPFEGQVITPPGSTGAKPWQLPDMMMSTV
jgi:hypothetical protein